MPLHGSILAAMTGCTLGTMAVFHREALLFTVMNLICKNCGNKKGKKMEQPFHELLIGWLNLLPILNLYIAYKCYKQDRHAIWLIFLPLPFAFLCILSHVNVSLHITFGLIHICLCLVIAVYFILRGRKIKPKTFD